MALQAGLGIPSCFDFILPEGARLCEMHFTEGKRYARGMMKVVHRYFQAFSDIRTTTSFRIPVYFVVSSPGPSILRCLVSVRCGYRVARWRVVSITTYRQFASLFLVWVRGFRCQTVSKQLLGSICFRWSLLFALVSRFVRGGHVVQCWKGHRNLHASFLGSFGFLRLH